MKTPILLRILAAGWVLALLASQPAPVRAVPPALTPTFSGALISPPPPVLCPGDQAALTVFIQDTTRNLPAAGYPVNIMQSNPPAGVLDPVSKVITNGTVNFVYQSHDNLSGKGAQTDVLTFKIGGYPTGLTVPITIADCSDYQIHFLLQELKSADFVDLYSYFGGDSTASRLNQQLTGTETGVDEVFFSIAGVKSLAPGVEMVCQLSPSIQGSGVFNSDGVINPQSPGFDLLTLGFTFDNIKLNDALLSCKIKDTMASFPFQLPLWDPDDLGLTGLEVPLQGNRGTIPIHVKDAAGTLTVWREIK